MRRRFPGLDFLRFYAALSVIIYHVGGIDGVFNPQIPFDRPLWARLFIPGWDAVTLFFVLSGFLITYLLLVEQRQTGTINVKKFYIRRALRIWPLYYLVLVLSTPILLHLPAPAFLFAIPLLPNVVTVVLSTPMMTHLWSIGAEEDFYLVWPLLVRLKRIRIPTLAGLIVVGKALLLAFLYGLIYRGYTDVTIGRLLEFLVYFRFEAMAIGAVGAWLVFKQHRLLPRIYSRRAQMLILGLAAFLIVWDRDPSMIFDTLVACVFCGLILNVATNPASLLRLEFRWTPTAGNISYGIYMFHAFVITALYVMGVRTPVLYLLACLISTAAAWLSYHSFERLFLRLKPQAIYNPPPSYVSLPQTSSSHY